ncbi:hypothetical protein FOA52_006653 [Chlamydomonas sp. UWO 241]|nr:hypothetical protein FOA52_006653 [Chlamydomonas sp. UWO 241]
MQAAVAALRGVAATVSPAAIPQTPSVPRPSPPSVIPPHELNVAAQSHGIEVHRDKRTVEYVGRHSADVGAIQSDHPACNNVEIYYFEMTVLEKGELGRVAIGYSPREFTLSKQPGWEPNSYGYHGDDGKKFGGNGKGEDYGPKFGKGDTVGAAYSLSTQEIFFTKNGVKLRTAFRRIRGELFPTLGLHSKGEVVRVNFGQAPFKYDIEALLCETRAARAAAVEKVPLSTPLVHSVVRQYLLHYGYRDTLNAFDSDVGSLCGTTSGNDNGPTSMAVDGDDAPGTSGGSASASTATEQQQQQQQGGVTPPWGAHWTDECALGVRQFVRQRVMAGDVAGAVGCIKATYPQILEGGPGTEVVRFHLATQQYIELVSAGSIDAAVSFAQSTLAPMQRTLAASGIGGMVAPPAVASTPAAAVPAAAAATARVPAAPPPVAPPAAAQPRSSSAAAAAGSSGQPPAASPTRTPLPPHPRGHPCHHPSEAELRDVVALIAYECPPASPLAWLLGPVQRERVADAANAALLAAARGLPLGDACTSGVERLLCQLVAVQATRYELNGSQGGAFELGEHLLSSTTNKQQQTASPMQL